MMTPEERDLLQETAELTRENHKILKSIRRGTRISAFLRTVYWILILGSAFGFYVYSKPYVDVIVNSFNGMKDSLQSVKNITTKFPTFPAPADIRQ